MSIMDLLQAPDRVARFARLLQHLPAGTADRCEGWARTMDLLRSEADGLWSAMNNLRTRLSVAHGERTMAANRDELRSLDQEVRKKFQARIDEADRKVAALTAEMTGLNDRLSAKNWRASEIERLVAAIVAYAKQQQAPVRPWRGAAFKATGTESAIESVRARIMSLKRDLAAVEVAPIKAIEAKAAMKRQIEDLAARGRPDVSPAIDLGENITFAEARALTTEHGERPIPSHIVSTDGLALTAWLHKDALIAALGREIDSLADDEIALTSEERAKKKKALKAQILALERQEEAEIAAQLAGIDHVILRRSDADVRAVLNLADDAPEFRERRL